MVMLKWEDKFATGIPVIDEQHKSLFKAISDLHEAMTGGHGRETVQQTLAFLIRYTETHFRDEERIMAEKKFPGLPKHKGEHEKLLKVARALEKKLEAKSFSLSIEVSSFLADWIKHHINEADFGFIKYMQSQGLSHTQGKP